MFLLCYVHLNKRENDLIVSRSHYRDFKDKTIHQFRFLIPPICRID